jgi:hypothetical protein
MNTEQIMVLAKRFNLEELRSAVETLVQERHKRGVLAIANGIKAESLVQELDKLRDRIHTCGPDCSKAGCVNRRLREERDALTLDLHTERCAVVAMQAERDVAQEAERAQADMHTQDAVLIADLSAENKVLRDAAEFEFVGYALPDSAFDGMVIRKQRLSSDSIPLYRRSKS